jgi:hypothetical protein
MVVIFQNDMIEELFDDPQKLLQAGVVVVVFDFRFITDEKTFL